MRALRSIARTSLFCTLSCFVALARPAFASDAIGAAPCGPMPAALSETLQAEARVEYDSAKLLFENRDYEGAIIKFQAAYDKSREARLLWNVAATHNQLKHYAKTQEFMRRYLAEGRCVTSAEDRTAAERAIAASENLISNVTFIVSPEGAEVFIDDDAYGQTPFPLPIRLDLGKHRIKVRRAGFFDYAQTVALGGAEKNVTVKVTLSPETKVATLKVGSGFGESIAIDGRVVATTGIWEGTLEPGAHRVRVTAANREPAEKVITLRAGERYYVGLNTTHRGGGVPTWVWVAGGAAVTAGLVVGTYFIFRPSDASSSVPAGTGGSVQLPSFRW